MRNLLLSRKSRLMAALATAAVSLGVAAGPAAAQQNGLINVEVTRVLNNNQVAVTVPINAAANVCGVSVDLLAQQLQNGPVSCTSRGNQDTTVSLPR